MSSSLINFIVERYLSNILEINPEKTKSSLWSGTVEMSNLKIKPEIFESFNLPYFELVNGYIGKFTIQLQLPRFYLYPIKVIIDKVFFHAKQKKLENLNKKDAIASMENYKNSQLKNAEEFYSELEKFKSENASPGMVYQIINNIQIEINDICFRFDDEISSPKMPFVFGILTKELKIFTSNEKFEYNENEIQNIPYGEINYKVVKMGNISIFLDTKKEGEKIDYRQDIVNNEQTEIDSSLGKFLGSIEDYFKYCLSEMRCHINNNKSHQYLLYQMVLTLNVALNDNIKNGKPKASLECELDQVDTSIGIEQIFVLLKLLSYIKLNAFFQRGIAREFYVKELTKEEKELYVEGYIEYYQYKYDKAKLNEKEAKIIKENTLEPSEMGITYDQIQTMREAAMMKLQYMRNVNNIDNQIKDLSYTGSYWNPMSYFSSGPTKEQQEKIELLSKQKESLMEKEDELNKKIEEHLQKKQGEEIDYLRDVNDDFVVYHFRFYMPRSKFYIMEKKIKPMMEIYTEQFEILGDLKKKGQFFSLFLGNLKITQSELKTQYKTIIETIENENGKEDNVIYEDFRKGATYIEFENNPNLPSSNYRFKFRNSKQMIITLNLYSIQYLSSRVFESLKSTINFEDVQHYAFGEVRKYIQEGFYDIGEVPDYQPFNMNIDIIVKSPILFIPQNPCDEKNRSSMLLRFGDIQMRSELQKRRELNVDYKSIRDRKKMFDTYIMEGKNFNLSTINDFDGDIRQFDLKKKESLIEDVEVEFSIANLIEPKNEHFENCLMKIIIKKVKWHLTDRQILFMIKFLDGFSRVNYQLSKDLKEEEKEEDIDKSKKQEQPNEQKEEEINTKMVNKEEEKKEEKKDEAIVKKDKKSNKVLFKMEFTLTQVEFGILKSLSPEERETVLKSSNEEIHNKLYKDYYHFSMNKFTIEFSMTNMETKIKLLINSICISDKEVSYKSKIEGENLVNPYFQIMLVSIPSKKEEQLIFEQRGSFLKDSINLSQKESDSPFIKIEYNYNSEIKLTEIKISMQKIQICANTTSLAKFYQFYQYYMKVLSNTQERTQRLILFEQENEQKQNFNIFSLRTNNNSNNSKNFFIQKILEMKERYTKSKKKVEECLLLKDKEDIKEDKQKTKMVIDFTMEEIEMMLPLDEKNTETKVMDFHFDLLMKINMLNEYTSLYSKKNHNLLFKCDYTIKDMKMGLMIFNIDFNIVQFSKGLLLKDALKEDILSNFRINSNIDSFIITEEKKTVMAIDFKMEPMTMLIGFREFKSIQKFMYLLLQFLKDMYLPYDNPIREEKKFPLMTVSTDPLSQKVLEQSMKILLDEVKKIKEEENKLIYNISSFNYQMDILFQMDKVSIKFLDNTTDVLIPLLNIESNKISFKYISKPQIENDDNLRNALVEIITKKLIPIEQYNLLNMYSFISADFNMEVNFFNYWKGQWEPIIEPWSGKLIMYQVMNFTKSITEFIVDDILNINLSTDSVRAFNSIMKKLSQDESDWGKENDKNYSKKNIKGSDIQMEFINKTGLPITFWLEADKEKKFTLDSDVNSSQHKKKFTHNEIGEIYRKLKYKSDILFKKGKFSFEIGEKFKVESHDFSYNHYSTYRIFEKERNNKNVKLAVNEKDNKRKNDNKDNNNKKIKSQNTNKKDLLLADNEESLITNSNDTIQLDAKDSQDEIISISSANFNYAKGMEIEMKIANDNKNQIDEQFQILNSIDILVKIEQNGICQEVIFESNIIIYNNLRQPIELSFISNNIYNSQYKLNESLIPHRELNDISKRPLLKPDQKIAIPLNYIFNPHRIYAAITNENQTLDTSFSLLFDNFNFLQNERNYDSIIPKLLAIESDEKINNFISIDMAILRGVNDKVKSIDDEDEENDKNKNPNDNFSFTSFKTMTYCFVLNKALIFENQIPFGLNFTISNNKKFSLLPLQLKTIDDVNPTKDSNAKIILRMKYHNEEFISKQEMISNLIDLEQNNLNPITNNKEVKLFKGESEKDYMTCKIKLNDSEYYQYLLCDGSFKLEKYYTKKKHLIFYFDYIINNKTNKILYCKDPDSKEDINFSYSNCKFHNESISLLSFNKEKIKIREGREKCLFTQQFSINTFGLCGVISLEEEINSNRLNQKHNDIAVTDLAAIISSSSKFKNSTILTIEQRFILYNKTGINISYKQYDNENKIYNSLQSEEITNDNSKMLVFLKTSKKFKRSINITVDNDFYSSPFIIDSIKNFDVKIPIRDEKIISSIRANEKVKNNILELGGVTYLLVRVIIQTNDGGLIYVIVYCPKVAEFMIKNETLKKIQIYPIKDKQKENLLIVNENECIPYVWNEYDKEDKKIFVDFDGEKLEVDFNSIEKVISKDEKYSCQIKIENDNKTRCLKIKNIKEDELWELRQKKRRKEEAKLKGKKKAKIVEGVKPTEEQRHTLMIEMFRPLFKIAKADNKTSCSRYVVKVKGFGLSIIDLDPKEVFYISSYDVLIDYNFFSCLKDQQKNTTDNLIFTIKNFQIDYCLEDSFKNILVPKKQIIPSNEKEMEKKYKDDDEQMVPFLQILVCRKCIYDSEEETSIQIFRQIDFIMQEMNINVDMNCVNTFLALQSQLFAELDFYYPRSENDEINKFDESSDNEAKDPSFYDKYLSPNIEGVDKLIESSEKPNIIFINHLLLSAMKLNLTLRVDLSSFDSAPGILIKIIASLGNSIAHISNSPLRFTEMIHENIFTDPGGFISLLMHHYTRQGILEVYKLLGSSDLLGNPIGFIDKIGTGFIEFFNEPRKGFLKGPLAFGEGLAKGIGGLISNVIGGSFEVVGKITGTLLTATKTIQGEKFILREEDEPENFIIGIYDGVKGGVIELGKGFAGVFTHPYQNAKREGVKGFFKGLGTGVVGVIVSPISAALRIGNSVIVGLKNTANLLHNNRIKTTRFRHPRIIERVTGLKPYDYASAEVKAMLDKLEFEYSTIVFFKDINYFEMGYDSKKISTLILTEREVIVIYEADELAISIPISKLKKVEVHKDNDLYLILFFLNNDVKKYIKTNNFVACAEFFSILDNYFQSSYQITN